MASAWRSRIHQNIGGFMKGVVRSPLWRAQDRTDGRFTTSSTIGNLQVLLANSQHVKNLRGHKTDRNDARWLAHLLRHGMIRASFIPGRDVRELRDLTRRRKQMVGCAAEERNRVQRVLQEANVQLGAVLSDVFGQSGLSMLDALMHPDASPEQIAELALK